MGYKVNPPSTEELRQLAVRRLGVSAAREGAVLTAEQAKQLLEEVAISKVEVEIQNVYLQDTCARLDVALNEITDLYDFAPIGCFSTDAGGKISKLNLSCASLFGQERNMLMGRSFTDFFPAPQSEPLRELMRRATDSGEDQQCDVWMGAAPQPLQHLQLSLSPQGAGQGYHMVLTNITARKALEDDLRANEARWKQALDAMADGSWDWDVRAEVLQFSGKLAQLYGLAAEPLGLTLDAWQERVHPDDRAALMAKIQICLSGPESRFASEYRSRCADGSWKWIACQGAVYARDAAGRASRMLGTHADVSARHALHDELLEVRGIQQAVFESLPQYLAVLDREARVLRTNALWNAYGLANGHAYRNGFVQSAYAELLQAVTGGEDETMRAAMAGIGDVLNGKVPSFQLEYSFASAIKRRWFTMHVMAVREGLARAVVSHQDVTRFKGHATLHAAA